jgi:hypothetical protein
MGVVVSPEDLEDTLGDEVFDFVVGARRVSSIAGARERGSEGARERGARGEGRGSVGVRE